MTYPVLPDLRVHRGRLDLLVPLGFPVFLLLVSLLVHPVLMSWFLDHLGLLVPQGLLDRPDHLALRVHRGHLVFLDLLAFRDAWLWVRPALLALQDPRALLAYLASLLWDHTDHRDLRGHPDLRVLKHYNNVSLVSGNSVNVSFHCRVISRVKEVEWNSIFFCRHRLS